MTTEPQPGQQNPYAAPTERSKATSPPPSPAAVESRQKLQRELSIFFVGLGVLLGIAAYYLLRPVGAPPLWGLPRHLAIGVPIAVLAVLHVAAGIGLAVSGSPAAGIGGAVASTLVTVFYFAWMISALGTVPISLISGVAVGIPILVWQRTGVFLAASKGTPQPPNGKPPR